MEAVILAGGLGTRLRSVVPDLPKPMAPVDGVPFLERLLSFWKRQGLTRAILSVGYRHEQIRSHFGEVFQGIEIGYAVEETPLGTGGGLRLAAEKAQAKEFLALNGDTFFGVDLAGLQKFHRGHDAELTLSLAKVSKNLRYGSVSVSESGAIRAFEPKPPPGAPPTEALVNGGVYLFSRGFIEDLPWPAGEKFSLEEELLPWALSTGRRLFGYPSEASFLDIGIPEDYEAASRFFRKCE